MPPTRTLFGLEIAPLTMAQVLARCHTALVTRQPLLIGVVNAAKIVNLRQDSVLRDSLLECGVIVADGQSVVWASRLLGRPLPERVAGIDLFEALLAVADHDARSVYLLGAKPEVLQRLRSNLAVRFPSMRIAGAHDGYFADHEGAAVADDIRRSGADMLFLGITSPKKETFLGDYGRDLRVPVLHGVGGSFDILAGVTKRAPVRWQRMGLEWAYRLLQEPRRMWRRYLRTNTAFLGLVVRERFRPTPAFSRAVVTTSPLPTIGRSS